MLLDSEGHLKLGDFGLAKDGVTEAASGAKSICGTPEYMAPEVLNSRAQPAADIFSLGLVFYEILVEAPLPRDGAEWHRLRQGELRLASLPRSEHLKGVVKHMLEPLAAARPSAHDILSLAQSHVAAQ